MAGEVCFVAFNFNFELRQSNVINDILSTANKLDCGVSNAEIIN